jgi:N-acetylmuramoyl-L-alanine amidase
MRRITHLVVHCTATPQSTTIESILRYWRQVLGWKAVGYHIIIPPSGVPVRLAPDTAVTNGVRNHNIGSLHVSYIGGVGPDGKAPMDNRTPEQKAALLDVLCNWKGQHPGAIIQGHRDFPGVAKACPSFDARGEYAGL